jgi:hypothetical protein
MQCQAATAALIAIAHQSLANRTVEDEPDIVGTRNRPAAD